MKNMLKSTIKDWFPPILISWAKIVIYLIEKRRYPSYLFRESKNLKNIHKDNRCFIIGLGNSINKQDLSLLKNDITIGVSGLFTHDDIKEFMPTYYVLSPLFKNHGYLNKEEVYISWLKAMDKALDSNVKMILHISDKSYTDKYNLFKNKNVYWNNYKIWNGRKITSFELDTIPSINSVSEAALSIALYLGFENIYMLGFDHTWYEKNDNHFDNKKVFQYFKKTQRDLNKEFKWDSEIHMRNHANIFKKYKALFEMKRNIYNANAYENTYVDTFPKVKYEDLFTTGEKK